jgi:hypothetical protein
MSRISDSVIANTEVDTLVKLHKDKSRRLSSVAFQIGLCESTLALCIAKRVFDQEVRVRRDTWKRLREFLGENGMNELQTKILRIVDDESGGIKFMKLVALLTAINPNVDPDNLEKTIRSMPELKVLDYGYAMGDITRVKMFVHRPLT